MEYRVIQKYKTVWNDGYITNILLCRESDNSVFWKLEGSRHRFYSIDYLMEYYKGYVKTWERLEC